jgi:hypothetical protein
LTTGSQLRKDFLLVTVAALSLTVAGTGVRTPAETPERPLGDGIRPKKNLRLL